MIPHPGFDRYCDVLNNLTSANIADILVLAIKNLGFDDYQIIFNQHAICDLGKLQI